MHHRPTRARRLAAGLAALVMGATASLTVAGPAGAGAPAGLCGQPLGNARYVAYVYLNILDRCPDPAGTTYWTGRLDAGLDRWTFVETVDRSGENVVNNVVRPLYEQTLEREPTADEIAAGVEVVRRTRAYDALVAGIVSSEELFGLYYADLPKDEADAAWLSDLYGFALGRELDPAGEAYWLGRFGVDGSSVAERRAVAVAVQRTGESARQWVESIYYAALQREPDASGFTYWVNWLRGKGQWKTFYLWTHFQSTNEAYRLSQRDAVIEVFESQRRARPLPSEQDRRFHQD